MDINLRSYVVMEVNKNSRSYQFLIPLGSPYDEAVETLNEFIGGVGELKKQSEAHAEQNKPVEESSSTDAEPVNNQI
jgi:hypothetical protein